MCLLTLELRQILNKYLNKNIYKYFMGEEKVVILQCSTCKSKQIRTTKLYRICNRCGRKERIDGNI